VGILVLLLATSLPIFADTSTESSQRGRQLFFEGEKSNVEPLTANVGAASIPVPATALPCVGCHGRDGLGRPEGGVRPSDITWFNLTKEYGGSTLLGRRYRSYDESSFLTAVTVGIDSAGNKLDSSMPRYNIARQDARDLIAYLKVIQDDFDPGVSTDEIVVGTLQPGQPLQARLVDAMIAVMQARFDEINRQGGVYGKKMKLKVMSYQDRQSFIAQADKLISGDQVFALVNAFSGNADDSLVDLVETAEIPSIAPYTQFPAPEDGRHQYTFYLHGGLDAQIAVLARRAGEQAKTPVRAFVFYQQEGGFESSANKALELLQENKITDSQLVPYLDGAAQRLADLVDLPAYPDAAVLFLGPSRDLVELFSNPAPGQQSPQLYLPGFFVNSHILKLADVYAKQLEMAYITVPGGNDGNGLTKFRQFMNRNKLDHDFLNARLFAFSATETLIEGVKRSGKRITRTKFVDAIEEMYAFDAGLNRPISYGSQRRTGLRGAYVVNFDTQQNRLKSTGTWVRLD
jgi:ABC-type branched-subunit amino acid transport system substrate-binding protein